MSPRRAALLALAVCLGGVVLGCAGLGLSVRGGMVAPPEIRVDIAGVRLISLVSTTPDCTKLIAPGCGITTFAPPFKVYTIWLRVQERPGLWEKPHIMRLFSVELAR